MTKTIDFRNLFIIIILKSLYFPENFFLLILFSIRRIDHRRFVLSLFSLQIDISKIFKRLLMIKSIEFRNLFIIMILKSFYYPDKFSLLIFFSIRKIDSRRFLLVYVACRLIFENNLREFSTFFLSILFNIKRIDHRRFVLSLYSLQIAFGNF